MTGEYSTRKDLKLWRDKDTVRWAFVEKDYNQTETCDVLGCSMPTGKEWLVKHGFRDDSHLNRATNDELLSQIDEIHSKLGSVPTKEDVREHGEYSPRQYETTFGSWSNALLEAGYEPKQNHRYTEEELLRELEELAEELGHAPTTKDMTEFGRFASNTYKRTFGSWRKAIEEANVNPHPDTWDTNETDVDCPTCGDVFDTGHGMRVHHAHVHGSSVKIVQECAICGSKYTVPPSEEDYTNCCSAECRGKWSSEHLSDQVVVECDNCGDGLDKDPSKVSEHNFCSVRCYGEWRSIEIVGERNPAYSGGLVTLECDYCNSEFDVKPAVADDRRFCSRTCQGDWRSENLVGEDHPLWEGGMFPYGAGWNEGKKEKVRERDGRECVECGRSEVEHLEKFGTKHVVHHIQKARSFDDPEKRNAMDNLVTLCRGKCHRKWEKMSPLRPQTAD